MWAASWVARLWEGAACWQEQELQAGVPSLRPQAPSWESGLNPKKGPQGALENRVPENVTGGATQMALPGPTNKKIAEAPARAASGEGLHSLQLQRGRGGRPGGCPACRLRGSGVPSAGTGTQTWHGADGSGQGSCVQATGPTYPRVGWGPWTAAGLGLGS